MCYIAEWSNDKHSKYARVIPRRQLHHSNRYKEEYTDKTFKMRDYTI